MRFPRLDRLVAAFLLTAFGGSLALLAQPSAASSLDDYDIRASVRYGCAPGNSEDTGKDNGGDTGKDNGGDTARDAGEDFVEVRLSAVKLGQLAGRELVLQVGLSRPDADSYGVFPEGGPSLVTLGDTPIKVRLAGPVHEGDHVFLRQLGRPDVITLPLKKNCHRIKPTDFGLDEPRVRVSAVSCTSGARANLRVALQNPNEVDRRLQKMGIEQIDYTVLLVRQDGRLAGAEPVGTLISFDEPSASVITLTQVAPKPANYQVRVIGLDGAVVSSGSIRLSCASTGPAPSGPARPSPSVPTNPPTSPPTMAPPSSTRPAPSTPAPSPTATVTRPPASPAPTSSAPTRPPASSAPARPQTSQPVASPPTASSSAAVPPASRPSASTSRPSAAPRPSATPSDPAPSSSAPAVPATSSPAPTPESSVIQLVEPRADYSGLPVFEKSVALVVLAFSAAMAALVGATVVNARRR